MRAIHEVVAFQERATIDPSRVAARAYARAICQAVAAFGAGIDYGANLAECRSVAHDAIIVLAAGADRLDLQGDLLDLLDVVLGMVVAHAGAEVTDPDPGGLIASDGVDRQQGACVLVERVQPGRIEALRELFGSDRRRPMSEQLVELNDGSTFTTSRPVENRGAYSVVLRVDSAIEPEQPAPAAA